MSVAKTILEQLGGNKFIVMTGAKDLTDTGKGLLFRIGRNSAHINKVLVEYNEGQDLYTMVFYWVCKSKTKGFEVKEVKKLDGLYCDQLQELFTSITGMYTRL